jgi:hypothetical protein
MQYLDVAGAQVEVTSRGSSALLCAAPAVMNRIAWGPYL